MLDIIVDVHGKILLTLWRWGKISKSLERCNEWFYLQRYLNMTDQYGGR
jgi:hypothetical protein